jgi:hypothetical protein
MTKITEEDYWKMYLQDMEELFVYDMSDYYEEYYPLWKKGIERGKREGKDE